MYIFCRNALSSAFSCWEALLGEYEKQAQVLVDCTKTLFFDVSCVNRLKCTVTLYSDMQVQEGMFDKDIEKCIL